MHGCITRGYVSLAAAALLAWSLFTMSPAPVTARGEPPATRPANRLIDQTSPYLLQHAHNPVDWYPWGEEAFRAARAAGKMIFLSIGYSTCYWCHVMERESFEDQGIAALLNKHFISIKVDREERPDVDDLYMAATLIYNQGHGGWPMSLFLDPRTLKPVVAATYFPPDAFRALLDRVAGAWAADREGLVRQAERLAQLVERQLSQASWARALGAQHVEQAIDELLEVYDPADGGFGRGGNKFPMPAYLDLLMGAAWESEPAREAVLHTLDRMAIGGMYDQVGGGFHRYSTDPQWLVPHFEKMLYDNGQLVSTYAAAYERVRDPLYAQVVRETLDWVSREMTDPAGGFYSAQDAEVDGREGGNYVWTPRELRQALAEAGLEGEAEFALRVYGLDRGPNFQDPHHPEEGRRNVLYLSDTPARLAAAMGLAPQDFAARLGAVKAALLAARGRRPAPATDDKVLAGWNGLMIAGFADGGRVLGQEHYLEAARRAAGFILTALRDESGGLLRAYRAGQARVGGFLEDHALVIRGLLALHRATGEQRWLDEAIALAQATRDRFRDARFGGWFDTPEGSDDVFVRARSIADGAVPGGNSVMLNNLLDLHELTGRREYLDEAASALAGISGALAESPVNAALAVLALHRFVQRHPEALSGPGTARPPGATALRIEPDVPKLVVPQKGTARLNLTLRIAEGYHVNAHEPGLPGLVGLTVYLDGGQGLALETQYPVGELYQGQIRVHRGSITLPVTLRRSGPGEGKAKLALVYQVCSDRACLAPATTTVPVEIER
jgi:uncharacterized protein